MHRRRVVRRRRLQLHHRVRTLRAMTAARPQKKPRPKLDPGVNPPVDRYEVDARTPADRDGNLGHAKARTERAKAGAEPPRPARPAGRAKSARRGASSR